MRERRLSGRSRVVKRAQFFFGSSALVDCVVHNLTDKGAGIKVADTLELPESLGLTFDGGYSLRPCRIVWRTLNETGVEFL